MAKSSPSKKSEAELRNEIAASRSAVALELRGLTYETDFGAKLKRSFRAQTALWVGAALVVGIAVTLMPRKKKVVVEAKTGKKPENKLIESGLVLGALKLAISLGRPMLMKYLQQRMSGGAGKPRRKF